MICNKCGKDNNEGTKFCTQCGNKIYIDVDNLESKEIIVDNYINDSNNVNKLNDEYVNNSNLNDNSGNNMNTFIKKKHTGLIITLVGCLIVAIIAIAAIILWKTSSNSVNGNDVNSNNIINTNSNNNNNNSSTNINTTNNSSNSNKTNDVNNLITDFDNYNVDVTMDMKVSGISMSATFNGTVDEKNQIEYLKMNMSFMGMSITSETYTDFKNGITYMSEPITGGWVKETGANQMINLNDVLDSLINMENVTKIDDNHFKVQITGNDIMRLLDASDTDLEDIDGDINADVFTNNGYIEEIKYDFSNLMDEFEGFTMDMKISNYNNAGDVLIPSDVITSATEW